MAHRRPRIKTDEARVDMTSLMDVVFIMLIFFVVSTSFVKEIALEVARPASAGEPVPHHDPVIPIRIEADNTVIIAGRIVDPRAIRANIENVTAATPHAKFVVVANRRSNTQTLVSVVDATRSAGINQISVAAMRE